MGITIIIIFAIAMILLLVFGLYKLMNPSEPPKQAPKQVVIQGQPIMINVKRYPRAKEYFDRMDKIESMLSVLQNLKVFTGEQANQLEKECFALIAMYKEMVAFEQNQGMEPPRNCPGYVRLAMLYEKQKRYDDGVKVCVDAIQSGAYDDKSSGKMYGRLARLIKKSGITYDESIVKLSMKGE